MSAAHSALGPSAAHRWKACAGSVNAERLWRLNHPDADGSSSYAEEGTRAHELCERLLNDLELPAPGDDIDTMEDVDMLRHCLRYRDYCMALTSKRSLQFVEARVTMPEVHASCFGTVDFATYVPEDDHLHVVDLKYGAGMLVEVIENPQAMLYAEGMRHQLSQGKRKFRPKKITVHIFQPRAMQGENIVSYEFNTLHLDDFVQHTKREATATETQTERFSPGDKQCHWCAVNPCTARQQQMHELFSEELEDLDDAVIALNDQSAEMSDGDIGAWLEKVGPLKSFIKKVEEIAYERAMSHQPIPGFKLVAGRGSYQPNEDALQFVLGDIVLKPPSTRSMSDLKKTLGTRDFEQLASQYYKRMPGKPTLVSASDKRTEWNEGVDIADMLEEL